MWIVSTRNTVSQTKIVDNLSKSVTCLIIEVGNSFFCEVNYNMKKFNWSFDIIMLIFIEISMLVSLVSSFIEHKSMLYIAETIAGILLALAPVIASSLFRFNLPKFLNAFYLLFIYGSVYLGTLLHFYSVPYWDKGLHLISGALLASFGFSLYGMLVPKHLREHMPAGFLVLYALSFAIFCGVCWEFYEFTCDGLFGMNLQRYASSAGKAFVGRVALMDTMGDLIADTIGAGLLCIYAYFNIKRSSQWLQGFYFHKSFRF